MPKNSLPKIFIVTVVFNRREGLLETIRSIRPLKTQHLRYLVIDGGSGDGTVEVIRENPDVVDLWISERDSGIYDAMNKAIGRIPREPGYVLFLGAGDKLVSLPAAGDINAGADIMFGDVMIGAQRFVSSANWKLRFGNTLHHQGLFISRQLLNDRPFDTRFRIYADFDLNQRLYARGSSFRRVDQVIATAEPGGASWGAERDETFRICRQNFGFCHALISRAWAAYHALKLQLGWSSF